MKFFNLLVVFSIAATAIGQNLNIIPQPSNFEWKEGDNLLLDTNLVIWIESDCQSVNMIGRQLQEKFELGFLVRPPIVTHFDKKNFIAFTLNNQLDSLGDEAYKLETFENGIYISSSTEHGLFNGLQSLLQLLPEDIFGRSGQGSWPIVIPQLKIIDQPRFTYRGMHLDVGRHFFPKEDIKKYIDYLALHKFNRFHWHLTEDQGWRIEIKSYPKLTEVGAWRKETVSGSQAKHEEVLSYDGKRYGGYYTQEEIREIVQYAQEKYITIIPEIEFPGHTVAALAAYPDLACKEGPYQVRTKWGVSKDILCPKETTFKFAESVLTEIMELFPSEYIHIGGDEAPKDNWKACSHCQQLIESKGLKDEHELQSYFIHRLEAILNKNGRKLIGWDEITQGGLSETSTVMYWRSWGGNKELPKQIVSHGNDIIMTPVSNCYFDFYQSKEEGEPLAWGGDLPVEKVYNFEPIPKDINLKDYDKFIGAQGNVWTEYMPTFDQVEYMSLPRMSAMSEVVWSPQNKRNFEDFKLRIKIHFKRLDRMGANYARHLLTK